MHISISLFVLVLTFATPLLAHFPENQTYKIFQFPDDHIPEMDGDLSDWEIVPDHYFFDHTYYAEVHRDSAAMDTTDHYIKRVAVAWNDTHNRLYFMAEVYESTASKNPWPTSIHSTLPIAE